MPGRIGLRLRCRSGPRSLTREGQPLCELTICNLERWRGSQTLRRWKIAVLVTAAIAVSYLDRQTLPVAVHAIANDIPLSNEQFSSLQSAFLLSYALMYAGGGKLTDVLGTRRGFTLIMLFWSLACASHAVAISFGMLIASRFLLGAGEGGGFPAATRVVAEWFPTTERATAMGIINAGTAIGAIAAPPLIAVIVSYLVGDGYFSSPGQLVCCGELHGCFRMRHQTSAIRSYSINLRRVYGTILRIHL
jgi:MFS transporter, ACS family, hexuronate transporter